MGVRTPTGTAAISHPSTADQPILVSASGHWTMGGRDFGPAFQDRARLRELAETARSLYSVVSHRREQHAPGNETRLYVAQGLDSKSHSPDDGAHENSGGGTPVLCAHQTD